MFFTLTPFILDSPYKPRVHHLTLGWVTGANKSSPGSTTHFQGSLNRKQETFNTPLLTKILLKIDLPAIVLTATILLTPLEKHFTSEAQWTPLAGAVQLCIFQLPISGRPGFSISKTTLASSSQVATLLPPAVQSFCSALHPFQPPPLPKKGHRDVHFSIS